MKTIGCLTGVLLAVAVAVSGVTPPDDPRPGTDIADQLMLEALARGGEQPVRPLLASHGEAPGEAPPKAADKPAAPPAVRSAPARSTGPAPATQPAPAGASVIGQVELSGSDIVIEPMGTGLLIYGNPDDVAVLQKLIDQLDQDLPARQLEIITLENKKASEVAQAVTTLTSRSARGLSVPSLSRCCTQG